MKFAYPRELEFSHPEYVVGCGGTETPMVYDHKTYLYVWNIVTNCYEYYCWETDMFIHANEAPWFKK